MKKLAELHGDQSRTLNHACAGKTGRSAPVRVSHVVVWTNHTADMKPGATGPLSKAALLANLPTTQQPAAKTCMEDRWTRGLPVYVIADR